MESYAPLIKILVALLILYIAIKVIKKFITRETVFEYQVGLLYRDGKFIKELAPGAYWLNNLTDYVQYVDTRTNSITIGAQEVISKDNVGLKLSMLVSYKIVDASKSVNQYMSSYTELYSQVQLCTRNLVAGHNAEELLEKRKELGTTLTEEVKAKATELGLEVEVVDIKDIMFPQEIRRIFSEVVRAKKEGEAALERARGEQAALRNLANAARTLENNPALMNLRILQAFSSKTADGSTPNIMLGMPQGLFPINGESGKPSGSSSK